ncbi:arylsulfatase [bacterium]|nr:arylsulfatase [bacterium]
MGHHPLTRRRFLETAGLCAAASAWPGCRKTGVAVRKPNILFILADDLGYGDLGCYGQKKFRTPHIDRLAAEGMRFTQHYSGSTVCAPSRCSLLTGLHTGHAAVRGNREVQPEGQASMPRGTVTIPLVLKNAGYASGIFGKWGLGAPGSDSDPSVYFDEFFGYNCQRQAHNYYPDHLWHNREKVRLDGKTYSHDLILGAAMDFIRSCRNKPFFCYLPVTIPHASMHAPEALHGKYRRLFPDFEDRIGRYSGPDVVNPVAAFPAMMEHLDCGVGRILGLLKELGLEEDTVVIFSSDNGPHAEGGHDPEFWDSNGPFRGMKRDLYEGGIRVPFLVRWPGKIRPGSLSDHVSAFWDMMPTVCELAGIRPTENLDGISILPALTGMHQKGHEYLYWEFSERGGSQAILKGDLKAVRLSVTGNPEAETELYDLAADPGETRNVAALKPDAVRELEKLFLTARTKSMAFPLF